MKTFDFARFNESIHIAVSSSNPHQLLPSYHPLNSRKEEEHGQTLLGISLDPKYPTKYLKSLLKVGVSAHLDNSKEIYRFPIHQAASKNNSNALDLLLKSGVSVNSIDYPSGRTALHICVEKNFPDGVNVLLGDKEIDVDIKSDAEEITPLFIAVTKKNIRLVETLIEHGASLNHTVNFRLPSFNKTILEYIQETIPRFDPFAVKIKSPRKRSINPEREAKFYRMNILIETAGIELDDQNIDKYYEIFNEFKSILSTLNKEDGDTYIHDKRKRSLLLPACGANPATPVPDFAEELLNKGFSQPNEIVDAGLFVPYHGGSPLFYAALNANLKLIKILLQHGANIETASRRSFYDSVLHNLLSKPTLEPDENVKECVMYLLDPPNTSLGRNISLAIKSIIDEQDILGKTAMHYASQKWSDEIQALVLSYKPNLELEDSWNETGYNYSIPETKFRSFIDTKCNDLFWTEENKKHIADHTIECCRLSTIGSFMVNETDIGMT